MAYSIQNLKSDITGVLHGTTMNEIQGPDNLIYRVARQLLFDIDPQETKRTLEFITPIYENVFDYALAPDVKGNRLVDIIPQVNRLPRDLWSQAYNQAFDIYKQGIFSQANMFTMNFNTGIKTIRINAPYLNAPVILNQAENITSNGTWTTTGGASNLTVDNVNYAQGSGSLKFNLAATGGIVNATQNPVDLSAFLNQSSLFAWVYLPNASTVTSVTLKWGSSNAAYYTETVLLNQQGTAFVNGWNYCQFPWASAALVGVPNPASISFLEVILTVTGAQTGARVNGIQSVLGTILQYEYYSKFLFRNAITGAFQETVTDDSNLINLDTETYNVLFNLCAYFATQQQQGRDAQYDGSFFKEQYMIAVKRYQNLYKSEAQKPQTTYYRTPDLSNRRYLGRRYNF